MRSYQKQRRSVCFWCLFLLVLVSCGEKRPSPPLPKPALHPGTVVFVDRSASMRGYFRTSAYPATSIQRFFQVELRNVISESNLSPVYLGYFDTGVGTLSEVADLGGRFLFNTQQELDQAFSGVATDFLGVLHTEELRKYTASLIVTDGVQSGHGGFDPGEMVRAIRALVQDSVGLYLLGVKSEFSGLLYPETPDRYGHRRPFFVTAQRPIFLWVASKDAAVARVLAEGIAAALASLVGESREVKVAGLAAMRPPKVSIEAETGGADVPIVVRKVAQGYAWRLARTQKREISVPLEVQLSTARLESFMDVDWHVCLKVETRQATWACVLQDCDRWLLRLLYAHMPGRAHLDIVARAEPRPVETPWWKAWSTNDDSRPENADKTLYLDRIGPLVEECLAAISHTVCAYRVTIQKP